MPCRPLPQPLRAAASSICRVWLPCRTGKVSTTKASAGRRRPLGTAERRAVRILHLLDHSLPLQSGYSFRTVGILAAQRKRGWDTVQMTTPKQYRFDGLVDEAGGWTFYRTPQPAAATQRLPVLREPRSAGHTSELQSRTRITY